MDALGRGPSNNQREELVLATVPVIRGKYSVSGTTDGDNLVYIMEFFLRLTYTCAELSTFDMVQIPGRAIVHGPPIPSRAFQHDFNERFDGP